MQTCSLTFAANQPTQGKYACMPHADTWQLPDHLYAHVLRAGMLRLLRWPHRW